eukprot:TRINITY_DN2083_c0_g1_i1.p1 TRINITY_DN2083_c0_g1~~TRINITY_DN2083_c0_g1_i1.p1  ORF type:complete len:356 (-),score=62.03 TRINITY_DN2083_c0_g1_i1:1153-2220(-)
MILFFVCALGFASVAAHGNELFFEIGASSRSDARLCTTSSSSLITSPYYSLPTILLKTWFLEVSIPTNDSSLVHQTDDYHQSVLGNITLPEGNYSFIVQNQDELDMCAPNWRIFQHHSSGYYNLATSQTAFFHYEAIEFQISNGTFLEIKRFSDDLTFRTERLWTDYLQVKVVESTMTQISKVLYVSEVCEFGCVSEQLDFMANHLELALPLGIYNLSFSQLEGSENSSIEFIWQETKVASFALEVEMQFLLKISVSDGQYRAAVVRCVHPNLSAEPCCNSTTVPKPTATADPSHPQETIPPSQDSSAITTFAIALICVAGAAIVGLSIAGVVIFRRNQIREEFVHPLVPSEDNN